MIEYITGEITELTPTAVIIETNGIGYYVNISLNTYSSLTVGNKIKAFIYEVIREDSHTLYGFTNKHERKLFLLLISVSGVGPNTARVILSSLTPRETEQAILNGNTNLLKGVKGIGAKTAERIIVDLKDKIKPDDNSDSVPGVAYTDNTIQEEALAALMMLGFAQSASMKVIQKIIIDYSPSKVEDIIKMALKML